MVSNVGAINESALGNKASALNSQHQRICFVFVGEEGGGCGGPCNRGYDNPKPYVWSTPVLETPRSQRLHNCWAQLVSAKVDASELPVWQGLRSCDNRVQSCFSLSARRLRFYNRIGKTRCCLRTRSPSAEVVSSCL